MSKNGQKYNLFFKIKLCHSIEMNSISWVDVVVMSHLNMGSLDMPRAPKNCLLQYFVKKYFLIVFCFVSAWVIFYQKSSIFLF